MTSTPNTSPASERVPEMVERLAIAMCTKAGNSWSEASDDPYAPALMSRTFWRQQAHVAIAAMREPTRAQLEAARDWSQQKYGKPVGNDGVTGCWQCLLDAALR